MKQTVVITGASRGIGRAVALAFAEKSASVKIIMKNIIFLLIVQKTVNCLKM